MAGYPFFQLFHGTSTCCVRLVGTSLWCPSLFVFWEEQVPYVRYIYKRQWLIGVHLEFPESSFVRLIP